MSRKTFLAILGGIEVVLLFFAAQFGLTLNVAAFIAAAVTIGGYLLWEGKLDIRRIISQADKFKDPKFWLAFLAVLISYVAQVVTLPVSPEIIIAIITAIMGILFKKDFKFV